MTAKEFLLKEIPDDVKREGFSFGDLNSKIIEKAMIEFTKQKVKEVISDIKEGLVIDGYMNADETLITTVKIK